MLIFFLFPVLHAAQDRFVDYGGKQTPDASQITSKWYASLALQLSLSFLFTLTLRYAGTHGSITQ